MMVVIHGSFIRQTSPVAGDNDNTPPFPRFGSVGSPHKPPFSKGLFTSYCVDVERRAAGFHLISARTWSAVWIDGSIVPDCLAYYCWPTQLPGSVLWSRPGVPILMVTCHCITTVRVGTDMGNGGHYRFAVSVERSGGGDPFADDIRHNTTRSATIRSPYDGMLLFFCTNGMYKVHPLPSHRGPQPPPIEPPAATCTTPEPKGFDPAHDQCGATPIKRATFRTPMLFRYQPNALGFARQVLKLPDHPPIYQQMLVRNQNYG